MTYDKLDHCWAPGHLEPPSGAGGRQQELAAIFPVVVYEDWNLMFPIKQSGRVSPKSQAGFAAFGKGVKLINESLYSETDKLSRSTSPSGILATLRS